MGRISKKKVKEAIKGSGGIQAVVAKAIGITRQSLSVYLKKHQDIKKIIDDEGDKIMDVAEHNIDKEIVEGNIDVSQWALLNRKKGKARGYGTRQEIEHSGETRVPIINLIEKSVEEIKNAKTSGGKKQPDNKSKAGGNAESTG